MAFMKKDTGAVHKGIPFRGVRMKPIRAESGQVVPRIPARHHISHDAPDGGADSEPVAAETRAYKEPFNGRVFPQRRHNVGSNVDHAGPGLRQSDS